MYSNNDSILKLNEDNTMTKLHKICSVYIGITICVLGLVGNFISFLVWHRINKKRSSSGKSAGFYLMVLAVIDSGLLLMFFLTESIQILAPGSVTSFSFIAFYCYFGYPMNFFFICASIWLVICITANRFIAVLIPHLAHAYNTISKAYTICASTLLFCFVVNMPHFFNFRPKRSFGDVYLAQPTHYGSSKGAGYYDFWVHCMFIVLVPWVTILILNAAIIVRLFSNDEIRGKSNQKSSKRERQTTIILLTITTSFLVFLIFQCLTQCFWMLGYGKDDKLVWLTVDNAYAFAHLGVVVNSAVNFLLYCISGSMFRQEMMKMFCYATKVPYKTLSTSLSKSRTDSQSAVLQSTDSKVTPVGQSETEADIQEEVDEEEQA